MKFFYSNYRSIDQNDVEEMAELGRSDSSDDYKMSYLVADKFWRFIHSRSVKLKAFDTADVVIGSGNDGRLNVGLALDTQKVFSEGRGQIKRIAPILIAFFLKAGLLGIIAFKGIALLVGKALIVSKLALLLASVIGIKKLLSKKHVTYEVVQHAAPLEHHHHDTWSTGWGRALEGFVDSFTENLGKNIAEKAQDMAYSAQKE